MSDDPALKGYSRTGFIIKHVAMKALKWAIIGAVGMGVAALIGPAVGFGVLGLVAGGVAGGIATGPLAPLGAPVGALLGGLAGVLGGGVGKYLLGSSLTMGAVLPAAGIAAAIGGLMSLTNVSEEANEEEARLREVYERNQTKSMKLSMLQQQVAQNAVSPGMLPAGKGMGVGRG